MRKFLLLFTATLLMHVATGQQKPAYQLFDAKGKKTSYGRLLKSAAATNIVLFGEFHNNPISHWLQLELVKDLHQQKPLVLGAEMFEQDNQQALDLYLQGRISAKGLDSMARLWKNYPTDYAPLVNFAKENRLTFAATNVPRRYASAVAKGGFQALDTLSNEAKSWLAPLPIAYDSSLPGYIKMLSMMPGHGGANLPRAQALKDATMAHFILKHYQEDKVFVHFNGAYHSDNYEGILWYLKKQRPELRYLTITTVSQKDISKLLPGNLGRADFIICVDEDMTTTY